MIEISPTLTIDEQELEFIYSRSSGPGGQNVNKVSTSVQLRFDVQKSPSLTPEVKARLIQLGGSRVTDNGVLIIESSRFRTQERNRQEVIRKFIAIIKQALKIPKARRPTRPTAVAKRVRLEEKRKRAEIKKIRKFIPSDDEE